MLNPIIARALKLGGIPDELLTNTRPRVDRTLADAILASPSEVLPYGASVYELPRSGAGVFAASTTDYFLNEDHWIPQPKGHQFFPVFRTREEAVAAIKSAPPPPGYVNAKDAAQDADQQAAAGEISDAHGVTEPFTSMHADRPIVDGEKDGCVYGPGSIDAIDAIRTAITTRAELAAAFSGVRLGLIADLGGIIRRCQGEAKARYDADVIAAVDGVAAFLKELADSVKHADGIPCPCCGSRVVYEPAHTDKDTNDESAAGWWCGSCRWFRCDDGLAAHTPEEARLAKAHSARCVPLIAAIPALVAKIAAKG